MWNRRQAIAALITAVAVPSQVFGGTGDGSSSPDFRLSRGARVAIGPFKDVGSAESISQTSLYGQHAIIELESEGTGKACYGSFQRALQREKHIVVLPVVAESFDPLKGIDSNEAALLCKSVNADFIIFGSCIYFARVKSGMAGLVDEAGMAVSICSAAGAVVFQHSQRARARSNLADPQDALDIVAKQVLKLVRPK